MPSLPKRRHPRRLINPPSHSQRKNLHGRRQMSQIPEFTNFRYISGTSAVTLPDGKLFVRLLALENTVLHADTVCRSCPDSLGGAPIPAGAELTGYFPTVRLTSGKVAAYLS